mmetsp:Transcript_63361/g.141253  ORF Transcript_63361/g.141253 Transcript_63361/m.141253 type:complete len:224 (+) Transcript_63361:197-868(+)
MPCVESCNAIRCRSAGLESLPRAPPPAAPIFRQQGVGNPTLGHETDDLQNALKAVLGGHGVTAHVQEAITSTACGPYVFREMHACTCERWRRHDARALNAQTRAQMPKCKRTSLRIDAVIEIIKIVSIILIRARFLSSHTPAHSLTEGLEGISPFGQNEEQRGAEKQENTCLDHKPCDPEEDGFTPMELRILGLHARALPQIPSGLPALLYAVAAPIAQPKMP